MKEIYQLPTRNKYKNTFQQGVTLEGVKGHAPEKGEPEQFGVRLENTPADVGTPMAGADYRRAPKPEPQTPHCTAITKKGNPCKAAPITGTYLCVGHSRGQGLDT